MDGGHIRQAVRAKRQQRADPGRALASQEGAEEEDVMWETAMRGGGCEETQESTGSQKPSKRGGPPLHVLQLEPPQRRTNKAHLAGVASGVDAAAWGPVAEERGELGEVGVLPPSGSCFGAKERAPPGPPPPPFPRRPLPAPALPSPGTERGVRRLSRCQPALTRSGGARGSAGSDGSRSRERRRAADCGPPSPATFPSRPRGARVGAARPLRPPQAREAAHSPAPTTGISCPAPCASRLRRFPGRRPPLRAPPLPGSGLPATGGQDSHRSLHGGLFVWEFGFLQFRAHPATEDCVLFLRAPPINFLHADLLHAELFPRNPPREVNSGNGLLSSQEIPVTLLNWPGSMSVDGAENRDSSTCLLHWVLVTERSIR
ncbi:translation initiation factor IF-2-like [Choloepus didactylus]|uniref:translation initiation factor IF-2-like n=1 Tax=Choloepus didactylus TaxID=27675 RepID=UPI00189D1881|nr:translation initiation factor IF-2-like [Choloepus didactylus]